MQVDKNIRKLLMIIVNNEKNINTRMEYKLRNINYKG